ncbi:ABC transporter permease [Georgenia deserti]|uniref:Transport permease protein n=1 Tax=Georgenia deserti TaxID=2093781 RepID=A0ABW4L6W5_9MICO
MTTITTVTGRPPASADAPRPGIGALRSSAIFLGRSIRHSLRDGEGLVMAIVLPVMLMLIFTYVFGGAISGEGYLDYVVPGIVLTCAGFGAASVATSVNHDITRGAMRRFRTMPIPAATVLAGHITASVARNLVATAVVIGVAFVIGFRPTASPLDWLGALAVVMLWIAAITALFAFVGLVAGSPEAASGYGFGLLFLPYVSSAFAPIETMPDWLQPVATYQPVNPVVETIRGLLVGGDTAAPASIAWCSGIIALAAVLITVRFPRAGDR